MKLLIRSDRPISKLDLRSTVRSMIGNIKETFLTETGVQKSNFLQDPGYFEGIKGSCFMLHATCKKYPMLKVLKEVKTNKID